MTAGRRGTLIRISISFFLILGILYALRDKLRDAVIILQKEVDPGWFIFGILVYGVALLILAVRLQSVFKVQQIFISYKEAVYLNFVGLFFNLFFPSAVGGDLAKAYFAYKHSGKKLASTTSVILDRLMGFVTMISMAFVAVFLFGKNLDRPEISRLIYVFLAFMLLAMFFFASKRFASNFKFITHVVPSAKWRQRLSEVYHAIHSYKNHRKILFLSIFLSFAAQTLFISVHYILARSLGVYISPKVFFIIVPVIAIITMIPSIGGLGVREVGLIYFLSHYMAAERSLALSLLLDILIYGYCLLGGIGYVLKGGLKAKVIHEMEELQ